MLLELGKLIANLGFTILGGVITANPLSPIIGVLTKEFGTPGIESDLTDAIKNDPCASEKLKKVSDENMGLLAGCMVQTIHNLMTHICDQDKKS